MNVRWIVAILFFCVVMLSRSDGFVNMPTPPPNVYTTPTSAYSNQDIAALIDTLRKELTRHQKELPETIAKTIEEQVEPSIKGVLSRNHYVPQ